MKTGVEIDSSRVVLIGSRIWVMFLFNDQDLTGVTEDVAVIL